MTNEEAEIVETDGVVGGIYMNTSYSFECRNISFLRNPRIQGTRVQVADVAQYYTELGWSIEKISTELDLTPDQVLEALKYYYKNSKVMSEKSKLIGM